jgi:hypothetical protein
MREKEGFREELEELLKFFPDRRILTVSDVERYTGRNRRYLQAHYGIEPKVGISIVSLARKLCS